MLIFMPHCDSPVKRFVVSTGKDFGVSPRDSLHVVHLRTGLLIPGSSSPWPLLLLVWGP